jgi:uncharacterized protein
MAINEKFDGPDRIDLSGPRALSFGFLRSAGDCGGCMAQAAKTTDVPTPAAERVANLDWSAVEESLCARGHAVTPPILTPEECASLAALYKDDARFRSHIVMERYRFGVGDYKYFANPLPEIVAELRTAAYPYLAPIANRWADALVDSAQRFPAKHAAFLKTCHKGGQTKPTPLMLHYEAGGYNCLHQDLYGEIAFPLQMVFLLGQPGRDWRGGEFILVEQQPRAQSKAEVVQADEGQAIIFTTRYRPVKGSRGYYRVNLRHGVSRVHGGTRYTLGIIFHDAK